MSISTNDITIKEYLTSLNAEIPDYQRGYSWENTQISQFLEDLTEELNNNGSNKEKSYFFGTVVVVQEDGKKKKIIDGQQRLTTITIFLSVLRNYVYSISERPDDAMDLYEEINGSYIGKETSRNGSTYKLNQRGPIETYFRDKIQKPNDHFEKLPLTRKLGRKPPINAIASAYNLIYEWLVDDLNEAKSDGQLIYPTISNKVNRIGSLLDTLLNNFFIVEVKSNDITTGYQIFQNLNGTGKNLTASDLIKSDFFGKSEKENSKEISKKWEIMQNKLSNDDATEIIRYYWNGTHKFATKRSLYPIISKNIKTFSEIITMLNEIILVIPAYMACIGDESDLTLFKSNNSEVQQVIRELKSLKLKSYIPLLMSLILNKYEDEDIVRVMRTLENLMFRNVVIANGVANKYEKLFSQLSLSLSNGTSIEEIIEKLNESKISDDEFKDLLIKYNAEGNLDVVRFILRRFEYEDDHAKGLLGNDKVHVEHIMPQNPKKFSDWGFESKDEDFDEYLWSLGNLVLLDSEKNTKIQNNDFSAKKNEYKKSSLKQIENVCEYSSWNKENINERTRKIADRALKTW
ncbi:DUF262 domain-containing protein [Fructilactobacillus frigidiflavus]|uniref:DUF262 domain-containing protein n=1 Tax=Fructilactobacillus frigidiflavus TaxID=3242688 RepID=UPI0037584726